MGGRRYSPYHQTRRISRHPRACCVGSCSPPIDVPGRRGLTLDEARLDARQGDHQLRPADGEIIETGKAGAGAPEMPGAPSFEGLHFIFDNVEANLDCPCGAAIASPRGNLTAALGSGTRTA